MVGNVKINKRRLEKLMKIVLMEGLGVSDETVQNYAQKLKEQGHEFVIYPKTTDAQEQKERLLDADVAMLANTPLAKEAVNDAAKLQFIDVAFTGVDHLPMEEIKKRGITVSNASGYATQAVAEWCIANMINLLRNMEQTQERCKAGATKDGLIGNLLAGKTVGIIGAGAIGKKVAQLAKAFDCKVIAYSRSQVNCPYIDEQMDLDSLLKEADIVSLHCPLTDATKGMIDADKIALMKESALLINTARGAVVDSNALAKALNEGKIAGAAIDVFEKEPPLALDHPLLHSKNTIVTPHIGFASKESLLMRAEIVFNNIDAWLKGSPVNVIK